MYDHHPPSRSHSPTKHTRNHSPIPHISVATLLPHHHSSSSACRQYSPNSKQADVSRLLDPSYASSSAVNPACPSRAYVDHSGDLHDPDYRHFPPIPAHKKRVMSPPRRSSSGGTKQYASRRSSATASSLYTHSTVDSATRRASAGSMANAMNDRYSTYPLVARPDWERDWATEAGLDDDDDEPVYNDRFNSLDDEESSSQDVHSPFYASTASSSSASSPARRASLPPSIFAPRSSSLIYAEPAPVKTFSTTSSPVHSLDEEPEQVPDAFSAYEEEVSASASSKQRAQSLLKRMKRASSGNDAPVQATETRECDEEHEMGCDANEPCEESKEQADNV
jgi:hypothetical protein